MYTVYKHTLPDGRCYIGCTGDSTAERWRNGKGYKRQPLFYDEIQRVGWDNIQHEILGQYEYKRQALHKEARFIRKAGAKSLNVKCKSAAYYQHRDKWRRKQIRLYHEAQAMNN